MTISIGRAHRLFWHGVSRDGRRGRGPTRQTAYVPRNVVHQECSCSSAVVAARDGAEALLSGLCDAKVGRRWRWEFELGWEELGDTAADSYVAGDAQYDDPLLTVSHIWSLICLLSMLIIRAPNSTPVKRN